MPIPVSVTHNGFLNKESNSLLTAKRYNAEIVAGALGPAAGAVGAALWAVEGEAAGP